MQFWIANQWESKVSFFGQCTKMQLITSQNFNIQTCFSHFFVFLFFSLECWFDGQIISRIHLILPNAYKLMWFGRNINGNRDVDFFLMWLIAWAIVGETPFSKSAFKGSNLRGNVFYDSSNLMVCSSCWRSLSSFVRQFVFNHKTVWNCL